MTAAEFATIRESCGLSQQGAADLLHVFIRTVQQWEAGRNHVAPGAGVELLTFEAALLRAAAAIVTTARELCPTPDSVMLVRYRTDESFNKSRAAAEGLTRGPHGAMIVAARRLLHLEGFDVQVEWAMLD